jgi:proliferating cell nuclear antigen
MSLCRLVYPNAKNFDAIIRTLSNIADEAEVIIEKDNIFMRALDPAKVSLIEITIPTSSLIEFELPTDKVVIGLNLSSLIKALPRLKKGDKVSLLADEGFYEILIEGDVKKRYRFRSIEVAVSEVPELNIQFKVRAVLLSSAFKDVIKDFEDSEGIEFIADSPEYLLFRALGLNTQAKLSKTSGSLIDLIVEEPSKSIYDTDYLSRIVELLSVSNTVELSYGTDIPVSINFKLADETSIKYLLAPKA